MKWFFSWLVRQSEPVQNAILLPLVIGAYIIGFCKGVIKGLIICWIARTEKK